MLAQAAEPFDSPDHVFEIKWDGTRCLAYVEGAGPAEGTNRVSLINRRRFSLLERYPELEDLARLKRGTVLDGEIVVLSEGKPDFRRLQQREQQQSRAKIDLIRRQAPATFIAFDIIYDGGTAVGKEPLSARLRRLREVVGALGCPHVIAPEGIVGAGKALFARIEQEAMEGLIAKRLGSSYQPGVRSPDWLKIKVATSDDFDVLGFTPGTVKGMLGALLIGQRRSAGSAWDFKGKVGSGFTDQERVEVLKALEAMPPLPRPPKKDAPTDAQWRATGLRCRVRYFEKTHTGMLRGPVFKGFVDAAP